MLVILVGFHYGSDHQRTRHIQATQRLYSEIGKFYKSASENILDRFELPRGSRKRQGLNINKMLDLKITEYISRETERKQEVQKYKLRIPKDILKFTTEKGERKKKKKKEAACMILTNMKASQA